MELLIQDKLNGTILKEYIIECPFDLAAKEIKDEFLDRILSIYKLFAGGEISGYYLVKQ